MLTITKPYNELQVGDVVLGINDPSYPDTDVTFDEPHEVREVSIYKGKTICAKSDGGRFWTMNVNDRRIATVAS